MPFRTALSGLNAASTELRVIGNNIANAGTTGFKKSRAEFADIYPASNLGTATNAVGSGVTVSAISQHFTQGNVNFTDNNLDLAVGGQGFFRLNDNGSIIYSRAGAFGVDRLGYVVNNANQRLTAYLADNAGNITGALGDLLIDTSDITPNQTTKVTIGANFNANATPLAPYPGAPAFNRLDPSTYSNSTSLTTYDSLGNPITATTYYRKSTTANEWETHLWITNEAGASTEAIPTGYVAGQPATMTFNSSGAMVSAVPAGSAVGAIGYAPINPGTSAANMNLEFNYGVSTQFGGNFSINAISQDGYASGRLSGIDIADVGIIQARYTNGQTRTLGQIALANFSNPQGLQQLGDTTWSESFDSGSALIGAPGSSSLGLIQSGALEGSNVDLTEQLVNMITAQRNFQANAQVITTADAITQTVINIR